MVGVSCLRIRTVLQEKLATILPVVPCPNRAMKRRITLYCGVCVILSHSCVWLVVGIAVVNLFHLRMRSVWCSGAGLVLSPTHVALRPWMCAARFAECWSTLSNLLSSVFMGLPLYLLRPGWFL